MREWQAVNARGLLAVIWQRNYQIPEAEAPVIVGGPLTGYPAAAVAAVVGLALEKDGANVVDPMGKVVNLGWKRVELKKSPRPN